MKIGLKRVDITPDSYLPMGGNAHADAVARKTHDPLFANIIVLRGEEDVILIEVDLLGVPTSLSLRIREAVAAGTGIPAQNILISAIHTHSAPDVNLLNEEILSYMNGVAQKISRGAKEAFASLFDGEIGYGSGYIHNVSFNRRIWMKDGTMRMNWEALPVDEIAGTDGPIDPEIGVLKICDRQGALRGVFVNFALHAALLVGFDHAYSKDWVWGLDQELRLRWGDGVLVYFANGAEGNINHIDPFNPAQGRDFQEAYRIGKAVADEVSRVLPEIKTAPDLPVRMVSRQISVRRRPLTPETERWADELAARCQGVIPDQLDGLPDEYYALDYQKYKRLAPVINLDIQVIRIGNALFYTIPGEGFCQMGLRLKKKTDGCQAFVIGLANGYEGYIPMLESFDNGGYEIRMCRQSPFVETAAYEITSALLELGKEVR